MIGVIVIPVAIAYFTVLFLATRAAYRWAARRGLPAKKRFLAAAGGFLIVYLPVFWDHIPTLVTHAYYCQTRAGFQIYKTIEQWKAENPGMIETLIANKAASSTRQGDMVNYTDTYFLNERINWEVKKAGPFLFNLWQWEEVVADRKTSEVLARYVNFSTGNGKIGGEPELRFWLHADGCFNGNAPKHAQEFSDIRKQLSGREE